MGKKMNPEPYHISNTKIKSRWFVDPNTKEKMRKCLNENINYPYNFGTGKVQEVMKGLPW